MGVQYDSTPSSGNVVYDEPQAGLTDADTWKRQLGLTGRAVASGVAALPMMAMDAGVATRNIGGDFYNKMAGNPATPDYELPSSMFQRSLTEAGMPEAKTGMEKLASAVEGGMTGGRLPNPTIGNVPSNFLSPDNAKAQLAAALLKKAQDKGFVVPPSTTNPSMLNRALETVAGKENVQNFSRIGNDAARTKIAAQAIGLNPDAPLTEGAVSNVLKEAGNSFEGAKSVPRFDADEQYWSDLDKVVAEGKGANEDFPGAARPDIEKVVDTYRQLSMSGKSVVPAVRQLREQASAAFSSGDSQLGRAYKGVSQAMEAQMDRAVQDPSLGVPKNVVQQWQKGRQLYAKASLVRDSMTPDGTVTGPKLAAAWRNDAPITGDLRDAADFATQYPKSNLSASASCSPVSHMAGVGSLFGAGAAEALTHAMGHEGGLIPLIAGGAAYPAARSAARAYLLSQMGQRGALPSFAKAGEFRPQQLAAGLAAFNAQSAP
jgi:hypothetical protein